VEGRAAVTITAFDSLMMPSPSARKHRRSRRRDLHPRGNFEAFTQAASKQKWLEGHPGRHEEWFYVPYGMALQKRFFDHFLKGEQNGWDKEPRVWLNLRRPFSREFELCKEDAWPLEGTRWTKLFLDAANGSLGPGHEAHLLLPVIPTDRAGVRTTKPVKHNGNDGRIAR
jgi:hypothetical protein